jgi:UDP-N-acetylmuramoylalanine--D-glutamate ligase
MMAMQKSDGSAMRSVLVLGMGVTGASCARHLARSGMSAWFADTRSQPPGLAAIRDAMPDAGVLAGAIPDTVPAGVKEIVVSPGVDLGLPLLADAARRGLIVQSDLDLLAASCGAPVIGITGSNGKSTVTSMAGAMLAAAGWRAGVGGNLGTPALDLLDADARAYVLELSSFQLERSRALPLAAAVVLNVAPDHLDKHGDMDAYTAAKARIYARCGTAIVNRDEPALAALVPAGTPIVSFGLDAPHAGALGVVEAGGRDYLALGPERLLATDELGTTGRHNVSNALAAVALVAAIGVAPATAVAALRDFHGLPHRMQVVHRADDVTWIDDSKATNVAAAVTSIGGIGDPLVLVAGGDGKGQSFAELAQALAGRDAVALLLGRDREPIARALAGYCRAELVDTLPEAVRRARELALPGATVLLAPACSSLDMFGSYEERGRVFAEAARGRAA